MDYVPVFIANGFYKNRTAFIREHVVYNHHSKYPKVDRYVGTGKLLRHRRSLLVDMPYVRHTTRHTHDIQVEYDKELLKKALVDRWNPYEERPIMAVPELFSVSRKIVNSDASRFLEMRNLVSHHQRLIIFYNFDYELEILRELKEDLPVFEWNGHRHDPLPDGDRWAYLVQYAAGSEGWNCTTTDAMAFWSYTYSYKHWHQAFGRTDRLNTPYEDLHYYVLSSDSPIDKAVRKALDEKRNFNEVNYWPEL